MSFQFGQVAHPVEALVDNFRLLFTSFQILFDLRSQSHTLHLIIQNFSCFPLNSTDKCFAGFALSAATGSLFITGIPSLYFTNPAFRIKLLLLLLAGLNLGLYQLTVSRLVDSLRPGDSAPSLARLFGALSLALWIGVLFAGRLIGFFKP